MNQVLNQRTTEIPVFKTWRTLKLGQGVQSAREFVSKICQMRAAISGEAEEAINLLKFIPRDHTEEIELVAVTHDDLNLEEGENLGNICARAKEYGLVACPTQTALCLRLAYQDQVKNEWLAVVAHSVVNQKGEPILFSLGCYNHQKWVRTYSGDPDQIWFSKNLIRFVFARSKV